MYPDQVPEYVGTMPAYLTEHTSIGISTGYPTYDEVLANSSADYLGEWDLGDAYAICSVDELQRQIGG